jgi:allophanate hydrolase subunit 1
MLVEKREIENAIQELNDVIMDFAIYQDSLQSVRETLEKIIEESESKEKEKKNE